MIVLIVANGSLEDYSAIRKEAESFDYIVAVDGGLRHIESMGLYPNLIVGDFDSVDDIEYYKNIYSKAKILKFEVRKDFTDLELAVNKVIELKPDKVVVTGVTGCRMDHTLGGIFILEKFLESNIDAVVVDKNNKIALTDKDMELSGEKGDLFSIVPITEKVEGIYLEGFEYPLNDATLKFGSSTGISNVFKENNVKLKIRSGKLLVIKSSE